MIVNITEKGNIDLDALDERIAYEIYLELKKRFEVNINCNIFGNCNYVGNCQCKSDELEDIKHVKKVGE